MDVDAGTEGSVEPGAGDPNPDRGASVAAAPVGNETDEPTTAPTAGRAWFPTVTRGDEVTTTCARRRAVGSKLIPFVPLPPQDEAEARDDADHEDAAGDEDSEKPGSLPSYVEDHPDRPGEKVYIASLMKELMELGGRQLLKTIERTGARGGRVGSAPKHNLPICRGGDGSTSASASGSSSGASAAVSDGSAMSDDHAETDDAEEAVPALHLDDTVGALFTVRGSPTFVVCEVSGMVSAAGHAVPPSHGLPISELGDIRAVITLRPLFSTVRSHEGGIDLHFTGESKVSELQVPAPFIQPITLPASPTGLTMQASVLSDAATHIWLRVTADADVFEHIKAASSDVPHKDTSGEAMFVIAGDDIRKFVSASARSSGRVCGISGCDSKLNCPYSQLVSHAAYHAIFTTDAMPLKEMCPLCYGPASECPVYIVKTSSLQPRVICKATLPSANEARAETGVPMQMARMIASTSEWPSTNQPIVCPECNPTLADPLHKADGAPATKKWLPKQRIAVWKYNMRAHWLRMHPHTPMPAGLADAIALAPGERDLLRKGRGFPVVVRKK